MQPHAEIEISSDLALSEPWTAELIASMSDTGWFVKENDIHFSALQNILHAEIQSHVVLRHDLWVSDETLLQMIQVIRLALLCCETFYAQLQVMSHHNKLRLVEPCHTLCAWEDSRSEALQFWDRKKVHGISRLSILIGGELIRDAWFSVGIDKGLRVVLNHSAIIGLP